MNPEVTKEELIIICNNLISHCEKSIEQNIIYQKFLDTLFDNILFKIFFTKPYLEILNKILKLDEELLNQLPKPLKVKHKIHLN